MALRLHPLLLLLLTACSSAGAIAVDASASDGPPGADAAAASDVAGPDAAPAGPDWSAVEALLVARAAAAGVTDLGLTIWDQHDQKIYEHMLGGFTSDRRVAVASASKLVAGLVIFEVIKRGLLTLDATTGQVLGWTGANAAITLRHLLSFTSGLPREAACTVNPLIALGACVDTIKATTALAPPGTRFDYGSTPLHVAARMAEVVTGQTWDALFSQTLRAPLGLPTDVAYFTAPRQAVGRMNPLIAGGLRASVDEYAGFLAVAFHKGSFGALSIGTPALFDEQAREPFPDVVIGFSPRPSARYGLASWLMCETPAAGCAVLSSPGAFGFTPWYDRGAADHAGYYAILGMELSRTGGDDGVVAFAVDLQQDLAPLIAAQLNGR